MNRRMMGLALVSLVSCGGGSGKGDGAAGSGGSAASGGASGNGGTSGAGGNGGEAACPSFSPCGGDLVGTWQVTQTCWSGREDLSAACGGADAWVSGVYTFKGTLTYNADLTYTSNLGGTDAVHYHYPSSCLQSSSCDQFGQTLAAGGVTNLTCTTDATAATCDCDGVAPLASAGPDGTYTISGSTLTTVNAGGTTSTATYCVQGNVLRETGTPGDGGTTPPESIVLTRLVPL